VQKKGPAGTGPFSQKTGSALLVALLAALVGLGGLLARLILALLARLALLLAGLLARLRLVLMALLLRVILARLVVLVGHVMNSMGVGYPALFSEPAPRAIVPGKYCSSKGFLVTMRTPKKCHACFRACKIDPAGTCA
jgi:hypothetical protein